MTISKKRVMIGLLLLALIWMGNMFYYYSKALDKPVFLKHYYDIPGDMSSFRLFYVDNIHSNAKVVQLVFPELGSYPVSAVDNSYNDDGKYYRMNMVYVTLYYGSRENMPEQYRNKVVTKAVVTFSDGKVYNVNLGRIYIANNGVGQRVIPAITGETSSDGSGYTGFSTDNEVSIKAVTCRFPELAAKILKININGTPLRKIKFPLKIEKGEGLGVDYYYAFQKGDERSTYEYDFPLYLFTDSQAPKERGGFMTCYTNHFVQSPRELNIKKLKEEQGR